MKTHQVCWHEGMLVLPQHFQLAEENIRDWVTTSFDWVQNYSHGIWRMEVNEAALGNFEIRIPVLEARLKDGTLISIPQNGELPVLSVQEEFQQHDFLYVYLLLPNIQVGRVNSSHGASTVGLDQRYVAGPLQVDELNAGGNRREVDVYRLNLSLSTQSELVPPAGFESLPILKLRRSDKPGATPEIDKSFIPPLLNSSSFSGLHEDILVAACSQIGSFAREQAEKLTTLGSWDAAQSPEFLKTLLQLNAANGCYPYLLKLIESRATHPFLLYSELCRLVGALAFMLPDWQPPLLPPYDHDSLGEVFRAVHHEINTALQAASGAHRVVRFPFAGTGSWLEVSLEDTWIEQDAQYFLGITSELPGETLDLLFAETHLDWKLGANQTITQIFQNAEPGLQLRRLTTKLAVLPRIDGVTYFQINATGRYWDQVRESLTLAMKVNDRLVEGNYVGKNAITVIDRDGAQNSMQFDLFVVLDG
ncbi:MAG: type VI secretion system baseplate subunit TssK [Planctomycetaceae bacterium]|nr:type VI secretion system baseplate subunit TssK [Planctomycetaceae bacterium]|tara:strand:+ start:1534 stop:2964 length:1431 start_codon:yes stop_codon:yes gene_type:complete